MLDPGTICRSKDAVMKCDDDEKGRLCRIVSTVPESRWRTAGVAEYKIELLAFPVTAFRRHGELIPLPLPDFAAPLEEPARDERASAAPA